MHYRILLGLFISLFAGAVLSPFYRAEQRMSPLLVSLVIASLVWGAFILAILPLFRLTSTSGLVDYFNLKGLTIKEVPFLFFS